jgi:hypothetical protein
MQKYIDITQIQKEIRYTRNPIIKLGYILLGYFFFGYDKIYFPIPIKYLFFTVLVSLIFFVFFYFFGSFKL